MRGPLGLGVRSASFRAAGSRMLSSRCARCGYRAFCPSRVSWLLSGYLSLSMPARTRCGADAGRGLLQLSSRPSRRALAHACRRGCEDWPSCLMVRRWQRRRAPILASRYASDALATAGALCVIVWVYFRLPVSSWASSRASAVVRRRAAVTAPVTIVHLRLQRGAATSAVSSRSAWRPTTRPISWSPGRVRRLDRPHRRHRARVRARGPPCACFWSRGRAGRRSRERAPPRCARDIRSSPTSRPSTRPRPSGDGRELRRPAVGCVGGASYDRMAHTLGGGARSLGLRAPAPPLRGQSTR